MPPKKEQETKKKEDQSKKDSIKNIDAYYNIKWLTGC